MRLPQHGSFKYWIEGRIFREHVVYPINIETFRAMVAGTFEAMAGLIESGPWAMIVTISGEPFPPADVAQAYKELARDQSRNKNRICLAYVVPDELPGGKIARDVYTRICAQALNPQKVFSTEAEAAVWVAKMLASTAQVR